MTDEEWAFLGDFILATRAPNGRKPTNHRLVLDGIFWLALAGLARGIRQMVERLSSVSTLDLGGALGEASWMP